MLLGTIALAAVSACSSAQEEPSTGPAPMMVEEQGSFLAGGTVHTNPGTYDPLALTPDGQTIHGDHAYVQYQIPVDARSLPLVMWHGGAQFSKTWETTPDGREGFQNIFLRRGFATYVLDQPRSGRASRTPVLAARQPPPGPYGEQGLFVRWRIGIWPDYFPGVQFSEDPAALEQFWRQQVPNTALPETEVMVDAAVPIFDRTGPAVLLTHSASGLMGWLTAIRHDNVRAIVSYEPVGWLFPEGEVPDPVSTGDGDIVGTPVPLADFERLTRIPIQLVYGDNIPETSSPYHGIDAWRGRLAMAGHFVAAINAHGGDAQLVHLPAIGVRGNTHFPFSDLNNVEIADLLSDYLREKGLDTREGV